MVNIEMLRERVEAAFDNRDLLKTADHEEAVKSTIEEIDEGRLRVAEPSDSPDAVNGWIVHGWVQKAVVLYFSVAEMGTFVSANAGAVAIPDPLSAEYHDKVPLKRNLAKQKVRVVPPGTVRYGAFLEPGCVVMPGYVNIGARVGARTMVDTWATVGSCAQIGSDVHLSGGVGIGGVLEPPGARPVIVEDGAFIGSRCIVVEGMHVGKRAVLGANVVLTASTPIVDVTGSEPILTKGAVPAESVVIPGTMPKQFPAGEFGVPCALVIGRRKPSTDLKTSLNDTLREFAVSA